MQSQSRKNKYSPSPHAGKNSVRRTIGVQKNGSKQTSADADACKGIGFHLLTSQLKPISMFEISMIFGTKDKDDEMLFKTVDNEAKQLQAIEDLYLIVKAQPKYKNLKEPDWKIDITPVKVLQWLLRKLGPLANGNEWTIDTYNDGGKTRFRFVVLKCYSNNMVKRDELYMPMDFLPMLKHRDRELHDLIIDVVALTSRVNKIPLWDEDGDFSEALELLLQSPITDNPLFEEQRNYYRTGPAAVYLRLIKRRRKVVDIEELKVRVHKFRAREDLSERQRIISWWLRSGLEIAANNETISPFTFVPNYKGCKNPVTPFRLYKFVWSNHKADVVNIKASKKIDHHSNSGMYLPIQFSIACPGKVLRPLQLDKFPERLSGFLSHGIQNICWRYKEYFFKKAYLESKTPATTLIEIFNKEELKHLI